jgi:glycosyltransferase involved in cell wall biosynthesis
VGGIPSSVEHGRDGWLIDPDRPERLAEAIEKVLDDEPLRHTLIDEGLRRARHYSLESFADELIGELAILTRECGSPRKGVSPSGNPRG